MSASQHHSEQLMSPHFASHASTVPAFNNIHGEVIPPASSLLYSNGNHSQFSTAYDNQIIMPSQSLHSGTYTGNYGGAVNYAAYSGFPINNNYRTSSSASSLPTYDESFKSSSKLKPTSVSPSTVSAVTVVSYLIIIFFRQNEVGYILFANLR